MIQTIKDFSPPPGASPYNPSATVEVPANDNITVELQGRGSDVFGFDRILPYGVGLDNILITLDLNDGLIIMKDVQLSALREHFLQMELLSPYIIQRNNFLRATLTNTSGNPITVNIQLLGYDAPSLRKLVGEYKSQGIPIPQPVFLYGRDEIPAGELDVSVRIATKAVDVEMVRATASSSSDDDMVLSLQIYNEVIKNNVFVRQLNDEFLNRHARVPILIGKNVPFSLQVDNLDDSNPHVISFLAEAYVIRNGRA